MTKTINVSSLSGLHAALAKAKGGETILLAGGNYGDFALNAKTKYGIDFPSNVTIASADANKPAVFTGLDLRGASNLTIDGVTFDYTSGSGWPIWVRPFNVVDAQNLTIRNSTFDGDLARGVSAAEDGLGTGFGLGVQSSSNVRIENNEFSNFYRGLVMGGVQNGVVSGNEMSGMRMDAMNFAHMKNILIENNYLHDFNRSVLAGDHADMIQFWTNGGTSPSTDIIIRGNTLDVGGGDSTQSIFMRNDMVDRGLAGREMFYQNVLIENNVIYNGHAHGITVGETNGLTIRNNSVLHSDGGSPDGVDAAVEIPRINVAGTSTGVTITGNAVSALTGWTGQPGWTVSKNAFVQDQDPNAPGYYADVFIASTLTDTGKGNAFVARPGGMIDTLGAGATATKFDAVTPQLEAQFHVSDLAGNGAARVFDASLTTAAFKSLPPGTTFTWDFGDGTTAKGALVTHDFPVGGYYDVKLTVKLPNGTTDVQTSTVGIAGSQVLDLQSNGQFVSYDHGAATTLAKSALASTAGIQLGAKGVATSVDKKHITEIVGSDNFTIDLTLQADSKGATGEVFRLHNSFFASVTKTGEMEFTMLMTGGPVAKVTTSGANLSDKKAHDIAIRFDDGQIKLFVDGALKGSVAANGVMVSPGSSNLVFGNPWGKQNFHGDLKNFEISVDSDDFDGIAQNALLASAPAVMESAVKKVAPLAAALASAEAVAAAEDGPAPSLTSLHRDDWDGRIVDIAGLAGSKTAKLVAGAKVETADGTPALVFDGKDDYAALGRMKNLEKSDQVAFSVDFARDVANGAEARLVWNHQKLGLTLKDDGLVVQAATADGGFKSFTAAGIGLNDTDLHRAVVMIDADSDRLQVVVDDRIVLDVTDTDFDITGGRESGWTLGGTPWGRAFDGEVSDFRLGDRFEFLDDGARPQDALLT